MVITDNLNNPQVVELLKNGGIGVIPTDTVYGLVCSAGSPEAVNRLYQTKHREQKHGTVIAANIQQLVELGIKERYLKAVERFWPNPISVRIPHFPPNYLVDIPTGTIAVRIPDDKDLMHFLELTGALQTTSANMAGEPVATTIADARACFGDTVDFYVDGGDLSGRPPSTIIRIVDDAIEVVRQGAVRVDDNGQIMEGDAAATS